MSRRSRTRSSRKESVMTRRSRSRPSRKECDYKTVKDEAVGERACHDKTVKDEAVTERSVSLQDDQGRGRASSKTISRYDPREEHHRSRSV